MQSKIEKCLKPIQKAEKKNVNHATQVNHRYLASRLLTLVPSEVTTHSTFHISQTKLHKQIHWLLNGMCIIQSPICWKS